MPSSTNPPVMSIVWPSSGTSISGSTFTLQAQLDNTTTTIRASTGATTIQGVVEYNRTAWVQNIPLNAGTNNITVTATDLNGRTTTTNLTLIENNVSLVVDPLDADQLNQPLVDVYGKIGDTSLLVYVNGVQASVDVSDSTWEADGVSVSPSGTAILDVQVSNSAPVLVAQQVIYTAQPAMVAMMSYSGHETYTYTQPLDISYEEINWLYNSGGVYNDIFGGTTEISKATNNVAYFAPANPVTAFIMPWEYASLSVVLPETGTPDLPFENQTRTRVMIEPGGQTQAGTTNVYLVLANAFECFSTNIDGLGPAYGADYYQLVNSDYVNLTYYGGLDYCGDVGLPPQWLQISGQALVDTGLTNVYSFTIYSRRPNVTNVWGATLVAGRRARTWMSLRSQRGFIKIRTTRSKFRRIKKI